MTLILMMRLLLLIGTFAVLLTAALLALVVLIAITPAVVLTSLGFNINRDWGAVAGLVLGCLVTGYWALWLF